MHILDKFHIGLYNCMCFTRYMIIISFFVRLYVASIWFIWGILCNSHHLVPLREETRVCSALHDASAASGRSAKIRRRTLGSLKGVDITMILALFAGKWKPMLRQTVEQPKENLGFWLQFLDKSNTYIIVKPMHDGLNNCYEIVLNKSIWAMSPGICISCISWHN